MAKKRILAVVLAVVLVACGSVALAGKPQPEWIARDLFEGGSGAAAVADRTGGVHAVWTGGKKVTYSYYVNGDLVRRSTVAEGPSQWARIALGPGNSPFVVYYALGTETSQVFFAFLHEGQWTVEPLVVGDLYPYPDIKVTPTGTIFVAAGAPVAGDGDGRIVVLCRESDSWTSELVHVPGTGPITFFRGLGLTPGNHPALAFIAGNKVYLAEKSTRGWVTEVAADVGSGGLANQALVVYLQSRPLVLYSLLVGSDSGVWAAERLAGVWAGCRIFEGYGTQLAAALDRQGALHVVYRTSNCHGYAHREPSTEEWVNSLLPVGPFGGGQDYGNIVVGAWDEIHVFRTVSPPPPPYVSSTQYLSCGLLLGRGGP